MLAAFPVRARAASRAPEGGRVTHALAGGRPGGVEVASVARQRTSPRRMGQEPRPWVPPRQCFARRRLGAAGAADLRRSAVSVAARPGPDKAGYTPRAGRHGLVRRAKRGWGQGLPCASRWEPFPPRPPLHHAGARRVREDEEAPDLATATIIISKQSKEKRLLGIIFSHLLPALPLLFFSISKSLRCRAC